MRNKRKKTLESSEREAKALERVLEAGVKAQDAAVRAWIRSVGPEAILRSSLRDIRKTAHAF